MANTKKPEHKRTGSAMRKPITTRIKSTHIFFIDNIEEKKLQILSEIEGAKMKITHSFAERLENRYSMAPIRPICLFHNENCAYDFNI